MKYVKFNTITLMAVFFSSQLAFGAVLGVGEKSGYVRNTEGERYVITYELSELPVIEQENLELNTQLFSPKLIGEFDKKYKDTFGQNEIEQRFNTPAQFTDEKVVYTNGQVVTAAEDYERQNAYGEFVVKRLTEYQIEEFANTNPSLKKVVELKEKISNLDLEVRQGYKVSLNYSLSDNSLDVNVNNPYDISMRLSLKMDPDEFGPSDVLNEILYLGYYFENKTHLKAEYSLRSSGINLSASKRLSPDLSASITAVSQTDSFDYDKLIQDEDTTEELEKKLLFGVTIYL